MYEAQNHVAGWGRLFAQAVTAWAAQRGYACELLFGEWVIRLQKDDTIHYITHSELGLNSSAADHLVGDKSTTYYILNRAGVPAVPHALILHKDLKGWSPQQDAFIEDFFNTHGNTIVIKPNGGAQGEDVVRVRSREEGMRYIAELFTKYRSLALSPYKECVIEYRTTILDGEVLHMYEKHHAPDPTEFRFNLSHGAIAQEVTDMDACRAVGAIARDAAKAVGIRFANVDIMRTTDGSLLVIEINADVTFTYYARTSTQAHEKAFWIFGRALDRLCNIS